MPAPSGVFAGGHCCSGATEDVFGDVEVAALVAGGTRAGDLCAPSTEHAGCAFRGEAGCSLAAADRPNICVRYACRSLSRELFDHGALDRFEHLSGQIERVFADFSTARAARLLDREWADLTD